MGRPKEDLCADVQWLRQLRRDQRLSQEEFAERITIRTSYLKKIEERRRVLPYTLAQDVAAHFGVPAPTVLTRKEAEDNLAVQRLEPSTPVVPPSPEAVLVPPVPRQPSASPFYRLPVALQVVTVGFIVLVFIAFFVGDWLVNHYAGEVVWLLIYFGLALFAAIWFGLVRPNRPQKTPDPGITQKKGIGIPQPLTK